MLAAVFFAWVGQLGADSATVAEAAYERPPPSLRAAAVADDAIRIDGALTEGAWRRAPVGRGFIERTPAPGAPAPVWNEVRVLYSRRALFVGVRMGLLPGEKVRVSELRRDGSIFRDDAVSIKLDVRGDRRTTLGFVVNPAGTQFDYVALDNGSAFRSEFDAIWDADTTVTATCWTAEFRIPVTAFGGPEVAEEHVMGLNVTRDHNARVATYDWAPLPPQLGPVAALYYGRLEGVREMSSGIPLSLIPYGTASQTAGDGWAGRAGGEVRMRLATDLWGELSLWPDFAQVDLDDPQLNLDRFPIFLPEKRPFFLSGAEAFAFGFSSALQPYLSRRIGLQASGVPTALRTGAKLYGQTGPVQLGLLHAYAPADDGRPTTQLGVARARLILSPGTHVGLIGTLSLPDGGDARNAVFGADIDSRPTGGALRLAGAFTRSETDDKAPGHSADLYLSWDGLNFQPTAQLLWVSESFRSDTGFVRDTDRLDLSAAIGWTHRPARRSPIDQVRVRPYLSMARRGATGHWIVAQPELGLRGRLKSGWQLDLTGGYKSNLVETPFELADYVVPTGRYDGAELRATLSSPYARNPFGTLGYTFDGGFFGGHAHRFGYELELQLSRYFSGSASGEIAQLQRPTAARPSRLSQAGLATLRCTPDRDWLFDVTGQYLSLLDTLSVLARVRYQLSPGAFAYLVFRERRDVKQAVRIDRSLSAKLVWRIDVLL